MFRSNVKASYLQILLVSSTGLVLLLSGCNQLSQEQVSPLYPYPDITEQSVQIEESPSVKNNINSSEQADEAAVYDDNGEVNEVNEVYESNEINETREANEVSNVKETSNKKTIQKINWPASILSLNKQLIQSADLPSSSVKVLVDDIKNDTKVKVDVRWLLQILSQQLNSSSRFSVIDSNSVSQTRKVLELDRQDSLKTRNKSMAVARHLKAPYILFTSITGNNEQPDITMQLMQMSTGELLWSQTDKTIYENMEN